MRGSWQDSARRRLIVVPPEMQLEWRQRGDGRQVGVGGPVRRQYEWLEFREIDYAKLSME